MKWKKKFQYSTEKKMASGTLTIQEFNCCKEVLRCFVTFVVVWLSVSETLIYHIRQMSGRLSVAGFLLLQFTSIVYFDNGQRNMKSNFKLAEVLPKSKNPKEWIFLLNECVKYLGPVKKRRRKNLQWCFKGHSTETPILWYGKMSKNK